MKFIAAPGTSVFIKKWAPKPGDIVTFKHHGYLMTSDKPKFPTLHRLRPDLTWNDVVHNWTEKPFKPSTGMHHCIIFAALLLTQYSGMPLRTNKTKVKPKGFWLDSTHRRNYFLDFAREMGFDPRNPDNWKNITRIQVIEKMVQYSLYFLSYSCSI